MQRQEPDRVTWTTIHTFPVKANASLPPDEWEELSYDINATSTETYRLYRADGNFIHLFKLRLTSNSDDNETSLNEIETPEVSVYGGKQSIIVKNTGTATIKVFNLKGQLVHIAKVLQQDQIKVEHGVYVIHVNNQEGSYITKVLVN